MLGVFVYFFSTADGRRDTYSLDNDACALKDGEYLVTGSGKLDKYLFDINKYHKVVAIYSVSDFAEGAEIWEVAAFGGYNYLLLRAEADKGPRKIAVYNVLKLDEDMNRVASSGWFDLSQSGNISDFTVSQEDGLLAITQISELDPTTVYIYPIASEEINVSKDADENNVRHVRTVNYTDTFSSETGSEIYFASYVDGVLTKYENISEKLPEQFYSERAERLYVNKILTMKQLIFINLDLFMYCIATIILGIATILALYVALIRRNRVAYLIFVWELMMAAVFITTVWINGRKQSVFIIAGLIFLAGSIFGVIILLLQAMDLAVFLKNMIKVSRGQHDIFKPRVVGGDMNALWNALFDLIRAIKRLNYNLFRIYEGYYRFAPKMIEKYMDLTSIADVKAENGKSNVINANLAMLHSRIRPDVNATRNLFAEIADLQDADMGSILCTNADASDIEMIFPEENKSLSDFVLKISESFIQRNTCMIIHNDEVTISVLGDDRQNAIVADCETAKQIFADVDKLNQLGLKFVMTESALSHEEGSPLYRYIGHFSIGHVEKDIKLYEMLDCLPERERRLKVDTKSSFEDAIEHIHTKDYYYARNIFAKIIRLNPEDEVARQYLFKCEDCLSIDNDSTVDFGLNR